WLGRSAIVAELRRCQEAVQAATGSTPAYFRPPFGYRNPWVISAARELKMRTVMWTLLPGDWKAPSAEWLVRQLQPTGTRTAGPAPGATGDVLCLHDGAHVALNGDRSHTLGALESCLPRWSEQGLKFVTISEAAQTAAR